MFDVKYNGLRLIPSKAAMREMMKFGFMIRDCKHMLEIGYNAPRNRSKDCEEKWFDKGNKTFNVVIVKSFNFCYNEDVYLITHVGEFTKK